MVLSPLHRTSKNLFGSGDDACPGTSDYHIAGVGDSDDEEDSAAGGAAPESPEQEDVLVHEEDHSGSEQVRAQRVWRRRASAQLTCTRARAQASPDVLRARHAVYARPLARGWEARTPRAQPPGPAQPAARAPGTRDRAAARRAAARL